MNIISSGLLRVPLYHQTSNLFRSSIQATGLGGKNPHQELGTIEFLNKLVEVANGMSVSPLPEMEMKQLQCMGKQVVGLGLNYRHGGVYFTTSRSNALGYAKNRFGSEILSHALNLFEVIRQSDPGRVSSIAIRYPGIVELLDHPPSPVMIVARDVPVKSLRNEHGGDPTKIFKSMQRFCDELGAEGFQKRLAGGKSWEFELVEPLPADQIEILPI